MNPNYIRLIAVVATIDTQAADWLRENYESMDKYGPGDGRDLAPSLVLFNTFSWGGTPQGFTYWLDILKTLVKIEETWSLPEDYLASYQPGYTKEDWDAYYELIYRVAQFDYHAAAYMRDLALGVGVTEALLFVPGPWLDGCFIWANTPQGKDYWAKLCYSLSNE